MATIVGGITTSHIPAIGNAIYNGLQQDPYWVPFFAGYEPVKAWLNEVKPDIAIIVYNDHGLQFFLDSMPTFAIGCQPSYKNGDEGWGMAKLPEFPGDPEFSWHLTESLIGQEFDMNICQEMLVDHGFIVPMQLMWNHLDHWPVRTVPLHINMVQHPIPSPLRCYKLGQALRNAIDSYQEDVRVVIFGTGGMSHQLGGQRAGFINKQFDLMWMDKFVNEPETLARMTNTEIMRESGAEGVETIMWLVMRGALNDKVKEVHRFYHAPVSNTGAGVMVLENTA